MKKRLVFGLLLASSTAWAHANLESPNQRTNTNIKTGPCGGVARGTATRFLPGETIDVTFQETIDHPGHYRLSFDPDGQDFGPAGPNSTAAAEQALGHTVIDLIPDLTGPRSYTQSFTFPNVECCNCSLQLIQVMTENPNAPTYYYSCADIELKPAGAPACVTSPTVDAPVAGGVDAPSTTSEQPEGCSTQVGAGLGILTLIGLFGLTRRKRGQNGQT